LKELAPIEGVMLSVGYIAAFASPVREFAEIIVNSAALRSGLLLNNTAGTPVGNTSFKMP